MKRKKRTARKHSQRRHKTLTIIECISRIVKNLARAAHDLGALYKMLAALFLG